MFSSSFFISEDISFTNLASYIFSSIRAQLLLCYIPHNFERLLSDDAHSSSTQEINPKLFTTCKYFSKLTHIMYKYYKHC
jgi:hypothetical protein